MAVVGLTGGIASGKSTVARLIRARGAVVIDVDQVARDIVAPGEPALQAIAATFGDDVLNDDGTLDRKALGALVFADPRQLGLLNRLTHPAILAHVDRELDELRAARPRHPWVVYEAALVIENDLSPELDELVVVVCEPERQIRRLMSRNGLTEAEARDRLAAQTNNAERRRRGTCVITNDGSLGALRARTSEVVDTLEAKHGKLLRA